MGSVIVASPPVFGETAPLLELAGGLVRRGHAVTALVGARFAEAATAVGARFVALPDEADFDDRVLLGANPERDAQEPGPDQYNWDLIHAFGRGMNEQHEALQRLLREDPDAALLTNSLFLGAWPVALGVSGLRPRRWVAVVANPVIADDDSTTPLGPIPDVTGDEAVQAHRAANAGFHAMLEPTRQALQLKLDELGAPEAMPPFYTAMYFLPDAVAALTVPEYDFPRTTPPHTLNYAGILPPRPAADTTKPEWWGELDDDRPVVVVTQGTLANGDLGQLVEPTLRALADEDVLVIAALGRAAADLGGPPPANARVVEYVPFDELLPRVDLFITNGGSGGTQLALAAGVPVVVCGITEEKPLNAARVAYHRVGIDLRTGTPTPEEIVKAATTILGDSSYRRAAMRLSSAYAAHDPVTTVEALLTGE